MNERRCAVMELTEEQKERVRFEVCHPPDSSACLRCVLDKLNSYWRITDHPMASDNLRRLCAAEAIYAFQLLPEKYNVEAMVARLENALHELEKAQVIH